MRKQQAITQVNSQMIHFKNRSRLIQQNRQLHSQIFRLQNTVNSVLTKNVAIELKETVQQQKLLSEHKQQTKDQISEIRKLKKTILLLKNSNNSQQKQDMRQALDQLVFIKRQKQKVMLEKQALIRKRGLKDQSLQLNKPISQQRKNVYTLYKATQRQNFQLRTRLMKMQKQINSLHKVRELAKTSVPKLTQDYEVQMDKIQRQIGRTKAGIKSTQSEWKPKIESLTNEYFTLKEVKVEKDRQIKQIQKSYNTYKNRILAMKQEAEILQDKARIAQIVVSPQKRQKINSIYQSQKQRQLFFQQFQKKRANQHPRKEQKTKGKTSREEGQGRISDFPANSIKSHNKLQLEASSDKNKQSQTSKYEDLSTGNQFSPIEENFLQNTLKNKIFNSVAVGTTFYYNQQEQEGC